MANINLGTGIVTTGQMPLDGKTYFKSLDDLRDLGENGIRTFNYYDSMVAICVENKTLYIWRQKLTGEQGLISSDYVYPVGSITDGIDYSGRAYNFFEFIKIDYSKAILKIDGFATNKRSNTDYNSIEVGDLIDGEYPIDSGRFIKAKVLDLPYTDENNLGIYFDSSY